MLKTETRVLPAFWACYLINGDASCMTDAEQAECDAYLARENLPAPVSCGESEFRRNNDAGTLAGDCCEFTFLIPAE